MNLCYIWTEKYRGFDDLSLSLSSKFNFSYDPNKKKVTKIKNEKVIDGLFHKRITEVTAIVGKNGTGKSNCLELICTILQGSRKKMNSRFLAVIKDNENFIIHTNETEAEKITANFKFQHSNDNGRIKGLNTIFFSNIYDNRKYDFSGDVIHASANNGYGYSRRINRNSDLFSTQINLIEKHGETIRNEVEIEIPKKIIIDISHQFKRAINSHNIHSEMARSIRKRINDIVNIENKFTCSLRTILLIELIELVQRVSNDLFGFNGDIHYSLREKLKPEEKEPTDSYLKRATSEVLETIKFEWMKSITPHLIQKDEFTEHKNKIEAVEFILSKIETLNIAQIESEYKNPNISSYEMTFNEETIKLAKLLSVIFQGSRYIRLNWSGISSGSRAYLTLFAVLNEKLSGTRNDTLICIDEGDLYLHPAWQIDFLKNMNTLLPKFYNSKLQIILTSHSPFLLTDLPRENVIILKKGEVIYDNENENEKFRTFGANIYDLYNEAFFLNKKRYGSLAHEHISNAINTLSKEKISENEINEIKNLVDIIGDKLLRNQLKRMLVR
ncbi:AAA family ATPase [Grimontia sp. SpTr1]|uniref:AAA family ATPase n=1 Tax=Grimontia sp. SpTr1 TaxID=2995319 RepID=UPI00248CCDC5|nr:AAA family ATPase [Grimontia sp. SpTr1]